LLGDVVLTVVGELLKGREHRKYKEERYNE